MLHSIRLVFTLLLITLIGIFMVQNLGYVNINFFWWHFEAFNLLVAMFILLIGFVVGWMYGYSARPRASGTHQIRRNLEGATVL